MPLLRRAASRLLDFAVRRAPAESREWGTAMLHELVHVDGDGAALLWALGGTTAICRHSLSHAFSPHRLARSMTSPRAAIMAAVLVVGLGLLLSRGARVTRPAPHQPTALVAGD